MWLASCRSARVSWSKEARICCSIVRLAATTVAPFQTVIGLAEKIVTEKTNQETS
jgi:hypothetical protein